MNGVKDIDCLVVHVLCNLNLRSGTKLKNNLKKLTLLSKVKENEHY